MASKTKKLKSVLVKVELPFKTIKELKAEAQKDKMTSNDYIVQCVDRFMLLSKLGYISAIEDSVWGKIATEAMKEGTIGPEASERLFAEWMKLWSSANEVTGKFLSTRFFDVR